MWRNLEFAEKREVSRLFAVRTATVHWLCSLLLEACNLLQDKMLLQKGLPMNMVERYYEVIKHMNSFAEAYQITSLQAMLSKELVGLAKLRGTDVPCTWFESLGLFFRRL